MPAKTPQDHKPKADTHDEEAAERFHYESPAGLVDLPSLATVPLGIARKNRHDQAELMFAMLEAVAGEDQLEIIDQLTGPEFGELFKAWGEFSGVNVGELLASPS